MIEKTVWGKCICEVCRSVVDFYYLEDQGDLEIGPYYVKLCPNCGEENSVTPVERCNCGDWKRVGKDVCETCEKRLKGDIGRFFRQYDKHERSYMQDLLCDKLIEELV